MKLTTIKPTILETFDKQDSIFASGVSIEALRQKEKALEYGMEKLDDTLAKAKVAINVLSLANVDPEQLVELKNFVKKNDDRYQALKQKYDEIHDTIISLKKLKQS